MSLATEEDLDEVYWVPGGGPESETSPEERQTPKEDDLTSWEEYHTPHSPLHTPHETTSHAMFESSHNEYKTGCGENETAVEDHDTGLQEDCDSEGYETAFEVGGPTDPSAVSLKALPIVFACFSVSLGPG